MMEEQDITQRDLAEKAGVDDSVISLARRGRRSLSDESESRVAAALGVGAGEQIDTGAGGSDRARSVRLVAGQSSAVAYPESSGEQCDGDDRGSADGNLRRDLGGDRSDLVSLVGLKNRRTFKRLNQSELARRTGLNRATINQAERKGRATRKTALLLANALEVGIEELAEAEQRSRFPERDHRSVAHSEEPIPGVARTADSSPATQREQRAPVTVELSAPVLARVDRFLDLLERVLRPRSSGAR